MFVVLGRELSGLCWRRYAPVDSNAALDPAASLPRALPHRPVLWTHLPPGVARRHQRPASAPRRGSKQSSVHGLRLRDMSSVRDRWPSECYECSQDKIGCLSRIGRCERRADHPVPCVESSLRRRDVQRRLNPAPEAVAAPLVASGPLHLPNADRARQLPKADSGVGRRIRRRGRTSTGAGPVPQCRGRGGVASENPRRQQSPSPAPCRGRITFGSQGRRASFSALSIFGCHPAD